MKNIPPLGPGPTASSEEPPAEALEPSRRRLLRAVAERAATSHPTVTDLVAVVGGHPNTTRHHLRVLVDAGLLHEERTLPAGGRGRPATRYAVTPGGRDVVASMPRGSAAEEYVALAAAFAERLAERGGDPGADARAIGKAWGAGLAVRHGRGDEGEGGKPVGERVVELLDRLGFSPQREPVGAGAGVGEPVSPTALEPSEPASAPEHPAASQTQRGQGASASADGTVLLRSCPLLDAARRHPEVVCQVHLGLVAGALEANDEPSDGLRLLPFARPGACVLELPPTLVG